MRTSPSYFAKSLTDVCAAGNWLPAAAAPHRRPLAPLPPLTAAAQAAADDMAARNYFGHDDGRHAPSSAGGPSSAAVDRVARAVAGALRVGGLVAAGWTSPLDVVGQLLCSAKHRNVLLVSL